MRFNLLKCSKFLLFSLLLTISGAVLPESGLDLAKYDNPPGEETSTTGRSERIDDLLEYRLAQEEYVYKEVMILAVLAIVSLTIILAFMKLNGTCKPRDLVTTAGLVLIIFSTIILVLIADTDQQMTAAIGVLGAIAGYLFGTASASRKPEEKEQPSAEVKSTRQQETK